MALAVPIIMEYSQTGLVRRFPTLGLVTALMVSGGLSFVTGLILQAVTLARREIKHLAYLAEKAPSAER